MRHPSAPAYPAPSQLARRRVLGAALLIGLAFALVPRTPTVHAQEPKTATPAPKSQSQSASKGVTVTDGRGQKIEIRKEGDAAAKGSETPGDSPDDEESAGTRKSGSGPAIRHPR